MDWNMFRGGRVGQKLLDIFSIWLLEHIIKIRLFVQNFGIFVRLYVSRRRTSFVFISKKTSDS